MQEKIEKRKVKIVSKEGTTIEHRDAVIKYFQCACDHPDHALRFYLDDDGKCIELYIEVLLSDQVWWKRIWLGFKYIMGWNINKTGLYGTWMMKEDDCDELLELLERFKQSDRDKF